MKPTSDLEAIRENGILASLAGFPFLIVFSAVWTIAGILTYFVPESFAPWMYVCLGGPAMPIAIMLEKRLGYVPHVSPDPILPLALQVLFVQIVAFPAMLLVWDATPHYLPVAFAAVVGAHFLPFNWIYRTSVYGVMGVVIAVGPYVLAIVFREKAMHYTGFLVGAALLIGAFAVRSHAKATWLASKRSE